MRKVRDYDANIRVLTHALPHVSVVQKLRKTIEPPADKWSQMSVHLKQSILGVQITCLSQET